MTPDISISRARSYGFAVSCTACGTVAHREHEIDADVKAGWHRDEHLTGKIKDRQQVAG
jgi:hypothetical protein